MQITVVYRFLPHVRFARVESLLLIENKIIDKDELKASCSYGKPIRARLSHDFPLPVQNVPNFSHSADPRAIIAYLQESPTGCDRCCGGYCWSICRPRGHRELDTADRRILVSRTDLINPDGRRSWPRNERHTTGWCVS